MSTGFGLRNALGLIPSADQLDSKWDKLIRMRDELNQMEQSEELKKFEELRNLIDSSAFQHQKRAIENLKYDGSEAEKTYAEWKSLAKSGTIRNWLKVKDSSSLVRYRSISESALLKQYLELKKVIESPEFSQIRNQTAKKEFVKLPEYKTYSEYQQLVRNSDIKFWNKFGNSDSYQLYHRTVDSDQLKRYETLKSLVNSTEYLSQVAYLKDKKRFLKCEEYQKIVAFTALDKGNFMATYRKLKKSRELDFFEKWEVAYEETFDGKQLNSEHWQAENWWGHRLAGASFSQENEMQGYNGTKNIEIQSNTLSLLAKKEKVKGQVWNPSIGLIPRQFEYSSAIVNNGSSFHFKEGAIEVKARFKVDGSITNSFSLTGEKPFPQIDLFRSTKSGVSFGLVNQPGTGGTHVTMVKGLNDGKYHIFRLERLDNHLIWKINGFEVYRIAFSSREPLFFHLQSSLHGNVNEHLLPHRLEVNWIRCFERKS